MSARRVEILDPGDAGKNLLAPERRRGPLLAKRASFRWDGYEGERAVREGNVSPS
jgi:hypothetical protein